MTFNKIDDFKLMSGVPLVFDDLDLCILQPKLKEIAYFGEEDFYGGLSFFLMSKEKLSIKEDISDFELFTYIVSNDIKIQKKIENILILTIQDFESVEFLPTLFLIKTLGHECIIDESIFLIIKEIYIQIFCMQTTFTVSEYNPANEAARKIVEKLKRRKERLNPVSELSRTSIFSNLISILTIGSSGFTLSDGLDLTVYQIYNLTKRFNLYEKYNLQLQAVLQGAKDISLEEWTKQI